MSLCPYQLNAVQSIPHSFTIHSIFHIVMIWSAQLRNYLPRTMREYQSIAQWMCTKFFRSTPAWRYWILFCFIPGHKLFLDIWRSCGDAFILAWEINCRDWSRFWWSRLAFFGWIFCIELIRDTGPVAAFGRITGPQLTVLFGHPPPAFELTNVIATLGYRVVSISSPQNLRDNVKF